MQGPTFTWIISLVTAYLAGSIPFALLIGLSRGVDIRTHGSGNVGATNCGRVLGRKWGIFCLVLDMLKGLLPVLVAGWALGWLGRTDLAGGEAWRWLAVALAAVLGHIFPVWLRFRGGKGVATGLGVILGLYPMLTVPALAVVVTWITLALLTRYISLTSVVAAAALPVYLAIWTALTGGSWPGATPFLIVTVGMAGLVALRHRSNLRRLLRGEEPKWGNSNTRSAATSGSSGAVSPGE